jgi:hypothetical protein
MANSCLRTSCRATISEAAHWSYGVAQSGDEIPMLIELQADQTQSAGVVYVSWP